MPAVFGDSNAGVCVVYLPVAVVAVAAEAVAAEAVVAEAVAVVAEAVAVAADPVDKEVSRILFSLMDQDCMPDHTSDALCNRTNREIETHVCTAPAPAQAAVQWVLKRGLHTCHTFAVLRIRTVRPDLRVRRTYASLPARPHQSVHLLKFAPSLHVPSILY